MYKLFNLELPIRSRLSLLPFTVAIKQHMLLMAIISVLAYYVGTKNFLLFHTFAEGFTIIISFIITLLVFHNYKYLPSQFIPILGITYGFTGVFDVLHTLAYKGLGVFPDTGANLPTQMWIIARYLDAIGMLLAGLSLEKSNRFKLLYVFVAYLLVSTGALFALYLGIFPVCFTDGVGLTPFKIYSEYIICLVLVASVLLLMRHRYSFHLRVYSPLLIFFFASIGTELTMTVYLQVYSLSNMFGHLLKIVAFFFLYHAIVETSIKHPFDELAKKNAILLKEIELREKFQTDFMAAQERFYKAFHMNPSMMKISTLHSEIILDINDSYAEVLGLSRHEIIGKSTTEIHLLSEEGQKSIRQELSIQGRLQSSEFSYKNSSGAIRTVLISADTIILGSVPCLLTVITDITDKKQLEMERARFDRLSIVGEMAAGIGHEVRNPMTTVRGYLQLFQRKDDFSKYNEQLNTMIEELDRANTIITDFLSLAKDKAIQMKHGNLNKVILSLLPLLQADAFRMGHEINAIINKIPDSDFDEREIRQLILNLVRNGFEAMEHKGEVVIRTYVEKESIVLTVQDSGSGIPAQLMDKLGTPFITTKDNGTGLGLPVCYRIADRHGAKIDVDTGPNGTTFVIVFKPPSQ